MGILVPGLWHTAQLAKARCWSQGLPCAYTESFPAPHAAQGILGGAAFQCAVRNSICLVQPGSPVDLAAVASSQETTWISGPSWAELLTTSFFSCSQWLPKTINSCDPVAAANLVILRVLADNKSGHSFAGNSLCNEGLRNFCHRTVPKDFHGELPLARGHPAGEDREPEVTVGAVNALIDPCWCWDECKRTNCSFPGSLDM